jgi:S-formylglutathione hydrolase FrmB
MLRFRRPLLALTILLPLVANAQSRTDCNVINSRILKQAVHYCVQLPPDYDAKDSAQRRYPVLYFLHGLGQNEQTLFSTGGWSVIEDLRRQHKIADFLVVAPEGKRSFYINSPGNKLRYSDFFLQEFMPHIESKYRVRPGRKGRAITGVSMGGYGALRFAFAHARTVFRGQRAERCPDHADSAGTLRCRAFGYAPGAGHGTGLR